MHKSYTNCIFEVLKNIKTHTMKNQLASYNGYTNYPTWLISTWIDNDQMSQEQWIEAASRKSAYDLSLELKETYEEQAPTHDGVYSDLITFVLAFVNWMELAENFCEAAKEREEEEIEEAL